MQKSRACSHCLTEYKESKSLLHETGCVYNLWKKNKRHSCDFPCLSCNSIIGTYDQLCNHLVSCLQTLRNAASKFKNFEPPPIKEKKTKVHVKAETEDPPVENDPGATCPFCDKGMKTIRDLKTKHPIYCNGIKSFEPKKKCLHCDQSLPISLCGLHSLLCSKNPFRLPLTTRNLEHADIACPECKTIVRAKNMPEHLATCLKHINSTMDNALLNSNMDWKPASPIDFISLASLKSWLKQ